MMSDNDTQGRLTMKALQEQITKLEGECRDLRVRLGDHEARLEQMELAKPAELRKMSVEAVQRAVAENPYVSLEVLADWDKAPGSQFRKGARIRVDHVPHLIDYVRHGLMLGIPENQDAMIVRLRAQAKAREEKALQEVGLAKAAADRAEAELAERRATAAAHQGGGEVVLPPQGAVG